MAASFANVPIAPVPAPTVGLATTNPYTAPPGATYAPSPRASAKTARFVNAPYPFSDPHVTPPEYTYKHQPPQLPLIPTGGHIPISVQDVPQQQQLPTCGSTSTPSSNPTLPHDAYPCYGGSSRTAVGTSPCALSYPELVFSIYPHPYVHTPTGFHRAAEIFHTFAGMSPSPQSTPPRRGLETTTIDLSDDVSPPPPPRPVYPSYPFHPSIMDKTSTFSKEPQRIIERFSTEIGGRDLSRRFQGVVNPKTVTSLDMTNDLVIFAETLRSGFATLPSWVRLVDQPGRRD